MAAASVRVTRGLCRARSSSSGEVVTGRRCTVNVPTPTPVVMAFDTYAFIPCTSETTAMIDVTATMLPSTVRNDRSLLAQMAARAMPTASRNLDIVAGR